MNKKRFNGNLFSENIESGYLNAAGDSLKWVPKELKTKELCEYAVSIRGAALEYVPEEPKTKELCTIAVDKIGRAFEFVPEKFKSPELCKIAVEKYGGNLEYVPENLKTFELCEIALAQGYLADELLEAFVPEEFKEELAEKYDIDLPEKEKVVKSNKVNELLLADKRYQKIIADIKILDNKKDKIIAKILSENIKEDSKRF